jgi:hypothetical protein
MSGGGDYLARSPRERPRRDEHPYSYHVAVEKETYYEIPLSGLIINYNPTPMVKKKDTTPVDSFAMNQFKLVPFAVGITYGGWHTFLCSYGWVYEAHWEEIGEDLYGKSIFTTWKGKHGHWNSGVVVVPRETAFKSKTIG